MDWEYFNFFLGVGVFRLSSSNFLFGGFTTGSVGVKLGRESEMDGVKLKTTGKFSMRELDFLNFTLVLRWFERFGLQMENLAFGFEKENEKIKTSALFIFLPNLVPHFIQISYSFYTFII